MRCVVRTAGTPTSEWRLVFTPIVPIFSALCKLASNLLIEGGNHLNHVEDLKLINNGKYKREREREREREE